MYLLVIFLPLLSAIIIGIFGKFIGDVFSKFISCFNMSLSFILSLFLYYEVVLCDSFCIIKLAPWIDLGDLSIQWGFLFDSLTASMILIITFISALVHLYSCEYMKFDPFIGCFMQYLSFFTGCMLLLVSADNFLQMFLGWEGVGLCSFLLINFWSTRIKANSASLKAMIMNRIGDFMLLLAILGVFQLFETLDYIAIFSLTDFLLSTTTQNTLYEDLSRYFLGSGVLSLNLTIFIICFCVLIGAVSKSAQLGLHTWLPDAMEGPTPVSALIHAATMVTAGVFVMIRVSPILENCQSFLILLMFLGGLTAFFGSSAALVQYDLKRIIAFSTCSQLGYMIYACGISAYSVSLFHLMNHAFFKALLFLSSGVIIHAISGEQDIRRMGGLIKLLPFTYVMMLIGSISLMGFPFLTGFYSKDVLLELGIVNYFISGYFFYWLNILTAMCTAYYSYRLFYFTFFSTTRLTKNSVLRLHEAEGFMIFVLLLLAFCSVFFGFFFKELYVGLGSDIITIGLLPNNILLLESEFLHFTLKNVPFIFSICGIFMSFFVYRFYKFYDTRFLFSSVSISKRIVHFSFLILNQKWLFDFLYKSLVLKGLNNYAYRNFFLYLDRGIFEIVGPLGLVRLFTKVIYYFSFLQSGYLYHYIYLVVFNLFWVVFFVIFYI